MTTMDVNNIIWACSPNAMWKGEIIKINGKGFEAMEAKQEHVE
jgi:hypothetical protein